MITEPPTRIHHDATPATSDPTTVDTVRPGRLRRLGRRGALLALLGVVATLFAVLLPAPADAATSVSTTGVTGPVREQAVPATCNNSAYGYYVRVAGPSVWARALTNGEQSQYARFIAYLVDETTGTSVNSGYTSWYSATTANGVQLPNQLLRGTRGDVLQAVVGVQWYSPSYQQVIGTESYVVSSYYIADQGRSAAAC